MNEVRLKKLTTLLFVVLELSLTPPTNATFINTQEALPIPEHLTSKVEDIMSKLTFQCLPRTLNFLNASCAALRHKQITLTSNPYAFATMNESLDALSNERFLHGIRSTPKVFILSIEIDSGFKKLRNKWQKYLQNAIPDRPLVIHFKNSRREQEMVFYLNGEERLEYVELHEKMNPRRLREVLENKFTLETLIYYLRYANGRYLNGTNNYSVMSQAINHNCSLCVRIMRAFFADFNVTEYMERYSKRIAGKFNRDTMLALLDLPFNYSVKNASKRDLEPIRRNRDLLIDAIENDNLEGVKFLLEMGFNHETDWENTTATTTAWMHELFDIFVYLIKNDFPYPDNFAEIIPAKSHTRGNRALQKLEEHIRKIQYLHDNIRAGRTGRVETFIEENPNLKYARDVDNIFAVVTAVYSKHLDIISLLNAHNMMPYDNGAARHIVNHVYTFNDDETLELQKMNLKYVHHPAEDHIQLLQQRALIKFNAEEMDPASASREVLHALMDLNKNEYTSPIIEYVAKFSALQIVIDLTSRFTFKLNPVSYTSSGLTSEKENRVYIGGKDLLIEKDRDVALGILIHEVLHYVMFMVYKNEAKPYGRYDTMGRKYFEMVEEVCKTSQDRHEGQWMKKLFQKYEPEQHHSELIARAVDLAILYRTNVTGMEGVRRAYRDLYEYYEYKILRDIKMRIAAGGTARMFTLSHCTLVSLAIVVNALLKF